jgi:nitroimidazol reductase NimA-like FMN-containing flavoprotein (pyridoxamine 5'-phosphate oxidase superfamily)
MPERCIEELTLDQCWTYLHDQVVGRLAVCVAGKPDVFPVNYRIDDRSIVVRTAPGFKLAAAALSPTVAFEVDDLHPAQQSGWSVVVRGRAVEIEGLDELIDAEQLGGSPWAGGQRNRYLRISPDSVTGRRIPG